MEVPYLNTGLLIPELLSNQRSWDQTLPWTARFDMCARTCCDPVRTQYRLRHYYRDQIESLTCKGLFSLYAAPQYGGLGLCQDGWDGYFTGFQRAFGAHCYQRLRSLEGKDVSEDTGVLSLPGPHLTMEAPPPIADMPKRTLNMVFRSIREPLRCNEEKMPMPFTPVLNTACTPFTTEPPAYKRVVPKRPAFAAWLKNGGRPYLGDLATFDLEPRIILPREIDVPFERARPTRPLEEYYDLDLANRNDAIMFSQYSLRPTDESSEYKDNGRNGTTAVGGDVKSPPSAD